MKRLLVVGGSDENSIGAAIVTHAKIRGMEVLVPNLNYLDVRSEQSINDYFAIVDPVDYIAYCVGAQQLSFIHDLEMTDVMTIYNLNVFGALRFLNALVRKFSRGRICFITSNAATTPMRGSIAYCSSKAAMDMVVKCAARELAPHWIVTGVAPGPVENTPMTKMVDAQVMSLRGWTKERMMAYESSLIPMSRRSTKDEVAALVLSTLLGPEMLTGQVIQMTGGRT
jgi:NAD(P)-dependent dehydrogenase (short-subunit alcohol dehydrogenase family)